MSSKHHEPHEAHPSEPSPETPPEAVNGPGPVIGGASDAGSAAGGDSSGRVGSLEVEVSALREEVSSLNDKYLRKLADDVNFRKRMAREKEEGQRYAVATLLGDLVPVLDDFDRAIASAEIAREYTVLHDGVALIRRQLGQVLESKYGLVKLESLGKPFDPNRHEAVAVVQGSPDDGDEAVVAEEFLPAYGLHERILRTAKVRVRMPAPKADGVGASEGRAEEQGSASDQARNPDAGASD